jgi:hypothetical protein
MTFAADVVSFSTGTSTVGTTIDVSLPKHAAISLAPKVVIAVISARTSLTDANGAADGLLSRGFAVSTASRRCVAAQSATGVNPTSADCIQRNDALLTSVSNSMSSTGTIQLIVDQQYSASQTGLLIVLGGTDISNATIVDVNLGTSSGNLDVTTVGHPARYIEFLYAVNATVNTMTANAVFCAGRCYVPDLVNHTIGWRCNDNVTPSNTARYCNDLEAGALVNSVTTTSGRFAVTGSLANGFSINRLEALGTARTVYALVLDGTFNCKLGTFLSQTDTTTEVQTALGFGLGCGELWSHCAAESTQDTPQDGAEISLGLYQGPLSSAVNAALSLTDPDNGAASATATAIDFSDDYVNLDSSGAIEGSMQLIAGSNPANALLHKMSDADPSQNFLLYSAFGPSATDVIADLFSGKAWGSGLFLPGAQVEVGASTRAGGAWGSFLASLGVQAAAQVPLQAGWAVGFGRMLPVLLGDPPVQPAVWPSLSLESIVPKVRIEQVAVSSDEESF